MAGQSEDRARSRTPAGRRPVRARRLMDGAEAAAGRLGEQVEGRRPWRSPGRIRISAITVGFFAVVIPLGLAGESWDSYQLEYHGAVGQVVVVEDLTGYRCGCAEVRYPDRPASTVYDLRRPGPVSPGSTLTVRYLPGRRGVLRLASEHGGTWAPAAIAPAAFVLGVLLVLIEVRNYRRVRDHLSGQRPLRGSG